MLWSDCRAARLVGHMGCIPLLLRLLPGASLEPVGAALLKWEAHIH